MAFDLLLYTALASACLKVQPLGLQILPRVMLFSPASEAQANTKVLHVESIKYTNKHLLDVGVGKGTGCLADAKGKANKPNQGGGIEKNSLLSIPREPPSTKEWC